MEEEFRPDYSSSSDLSMAAEEIESFLSSKSKEDETIEVKKVGRFFLCPVEGEKFTRRNTLARHYETIHHKQVYKMHCTDCKKGYLRAEYLIDHGMKVHHWSAEQVEEAKDVTAILCSNTKYVSPKGRKLEEINTSNKENENPVTTEDEIPKKIPKKTSARKVLFGKMTGTSTPNDNLDDSTFEDVERIASPIFAKQPFNSFVFGKRNVVGNNIFAKFLPPKVNVTRSTTISTTTDVNTVTTMPTTTNIPVPTAIPAATGRSNKNLCREKQSELPLPPPPPTCLLEAKKQLEQARRDRDLKVKQVDELYTVTQRFRLKEGCAQCVKEKKIAKEQEIKIQKLEEENKRMRQALQSLMGQPLL